MATYSIPLARSFKKDFIYRNLNKIIIFLLILFLLVIVPVVYVFHRDSSLSYNYSFNGYEVFYHFFLFNFISFLELYYSSKF